MIIMVLMLVRILPLFPTAAMRVSSFISFTISVILEFMVLLLVHLPVFPALLVIRVAVIPAFVPVLVSLTFLLVITMIVLCDPHYVSYLNPSGSPHA